jgi:hypothetical protein
MSRNALSDTNLRLDDVEAEVDVDVDADEQAYDRLLTTVIWRNAYVL